MKTFKKESLISQKKKIGMKYNKPQMIQKKKMKNFLIKKEKPKQKYLIFTTKIYFLDLQMKMKKKEDFLNWQ